MASFTVPDAKCCGSSQLAILNSHGNMAFYKCHKCGKQFHGPFQQKLDVQMLLPPAVPVVVPASTQITELPPALLDEHLASGNQMMGGDYECGCPKCGGEIVHVKAPELPSRERRRSPFSKI